MFNTDSSYAIFFFAATLKAAVGFFIVIKSQLIVWRRQSCSFILPTFAPSPFLTRRAAGPQSSIAPTDVCLDERERNRVTHLKLFRAACLSSHWTRCPLSLSLHLFKKGPIQVEEVCEQLKCAQGLRFFWSAWRTDMLFNAGYGLMLSTPALGSWKKRWSLMRLNVHNNSNNSDNDSNDDY